MTQGPTSPSRGERAGPSAPTSGPLYSDHGPTRRDFAWEAFKNYLAPDNGNQAPDNGKKVLAQLDYNEHQTPYLTGVIAWLHLKPVPSSETKNTARPGTGREGDPYISVESPHSRIAVLTAYPPSKLDWVARHQMNEDEARAIIRLGYLARIIIHDPILTVGDDSDNKFVQAIHSTDTLPKYGLKREGFVANLLRAFGKAATYRAHHLDGDWEVQTEGLVAERRSQRWRMLPPTEHGLAVVGRVVEPFTRVT